MLTEDERRRVEWRRETLVKIMSVIISNAVSENRYNEMAAREAQLYLEQLENVIDQHDSATSENKNKYFWKK